MGVNILRVLREVWKIHIYFKIINLISSYILKQVESNKNRSPLSEDWIPNEEVEGNAYCRYPET